MKNVVVKVLSILHPENYQEATRKLNPSQDQAGGGGYAMKVISLWQPWASFMAWGIKTIETRHWPLPKNIKGPIAVHAAKKVVKVIDPYFDDALLSRNLSYRDLPGGFILCYFDSAQCEIINYRQDGVPDYPERAFGDYTPGRYMWKMEGLNVLPWPVMIQGKQGIWNWDFNEGVKPQVECKASKV